jgi:hypothetical protein
MVAVAVVTRKRNLDVACRASKVFFVEIVIIATHMT